MTPSPDGEVLPSILLRIQEVIVNASDGFVFLEPAVLQKNYLKQEEKSYRF